MKKKSFNVERLKNRVRFCLYSSDKSDDVFDKVYSFAMNQVLQMIEDLECDDEKLINRL